jgi:hypothetical protein
LRTAARLEQHSAVGVNRGYPHNSRIRRWIQGRCGGSIVAHSGYNEVPARDDQTDDSFQRDIGWADQTYVDYRYMLASEPGKGVGNSIGRTAGG